MLIFFLWLVFCIHITNHALWRVFKTRQSLDIRWVESLVVFALLAIINYNRQWRKQETCILTHIQKQNQVCLVSTGKAKLAIVEHELLHQSRGCCLNNSGGAWRINLLRLLHTAVCRPNHLSNNANTFWLNNMLKIDRSICMHRKETEARSQKRFDLTSSTIFHAFTNSINRRLSHTDIRQVFSDGMCLSP
jgi:hypothetical protein